jgi:hypothetical protein
MVMDGVGGVGGVDGVDGVDGVELPPRKLGTFETALGERNDVVEVSTLVSVERKLA